MDASRTEKSTWSVSLARKAAVPVLIFAIVLLGYYLSTYLADRQFVQWCSGDRIHPDCWYQHHVYLAKALLNGTVDVAATGMPDFYQDVIFDGAKKYLPFPPGPAIIMTPFVAIWGTGFSQIYLSMGLGAINVALFWYLLTLLNISRTTKLLLIPFFAFGTAHFYSATTGTTWFYNHVVSTTFLLLALIFLFRKASPVVPAFFLGFAFLSRELTILSAPFFLYFIWRQRHDSFTREALLDRQSLFQMGLFCLALVPFAAVIFTYSIIRLGSPIETGYDPIYEVYTKGGLPYAFYLEQFPDAPRFNQFDIRNIPLHLYTIFLMPPQFHPDWSVFQPSRYGMSVVLTSPAFVFAFLVKRDHYLKPALWVAIALILGPILIYFTQGWVQFGYRFLLDFAPFLLILTAWGFDDNTSPTARRIQVALVAFSIVAGIWGRYWANELAW